MGTRGGPSQQIARQAARLRLHGVSAAAATMLLLLFAGSGAAQEATEPLRPGDRIRVWAPFAGISGEEGRLVEHADSLLLLRSSGRSFEVPLADVDRVEVERRVGNHLGAGALIGGVTGVALTTAFLIPFCGDSDTVCEADEVVQSIGFIGLPAVVLGSVVGLVVGRYEWVEVDLGLGRGAALPGRVKPLRAPERQKE